MILLIGYPLSARESLRLLLSYLEEAFSIQYRISGLEYPMLYAPCPMLNNADFKIFLPAIGKILSSIIRPPSSFVHRPSSLICPVIAAFGPLPSALCPLSSVFDN
ncbi:MAG: hypothetical protein AB1Z29_27055 [Desulfobacterales bacterium]